MHIQQTKKLIGLLLQKLTMAIFYSIVYLLRIFCILMLLKKERFQCCLPLTINVALFSLNISFPSSSCAPFLASHVNCELSSIPTFWRYISLFPGDFWTNSDKTKTNQRKKLQTSKPSYTKKWKLQIIEAEQCALLGRELYRNTTIISKLRL